MSMEAFDRMRFHDEVCLKLREAERQEKETDVRYSIEEVMAAMEEVLGSE